MKMVSCALRLIFAASTVAGFLGCKQIAVLRDSNGAIYWSFEYYLRKNLETGGLDTVPNGRWFEWDSLGNKVAEGRFRDGLADGSSRAFYRGGKTRVFSHFQKGKLDSSVTYYETGEVLERVKGGPEDTTFRYESDGTVDTTIGIKWLD
jgi:hypothetical protein